jgi:hypothetical protein
MQHTVKHLSFVVALLYLVSRPHAVSRDSVQEPRS